MQKDEKMLLHDFNLLAWCTGTASGSVLASLRTSSYQNTVFRIHRYLTQKTAPGSGSLRATRCTSMKALKWDWESKMSSSMLCLQSSSWRPEVYNLSAHQLIKYIRETYRCFCLSPRYVCLSTLFWTVCAMKLGQHLSADGRSWNIIDRVIQSTTAVYLWRRGTAWHNCKAIHTNGGNRSNEQWWAWLCWVVDTSWRRGHGRGLARPIQSANCWLAEKHCLPWECSLSCAQYRRILIHRVVSSWAIVCIADPLALSRQETLRWRACKGITHRHWSESWYCNA